ncbi:MAG: hypothetical protein KKB20_01870 [Proteobacteria bacterium]|nr:hypothetical protein [Pseudomonadota bacterium]
MTTRNILIFSGVALALLIVVFAANTYVVQPSLQPKLAEPKAAEVVQSGGAAADSSFVTFTLEKILAASSENVKEPEAFKARDIERNAFLWPGERPPEKDEMLLTTDETQQAKAETPLVLRMTIIGANKKQAVINEELLTEGLTIEGRKVARIEKDSVVLVSSIGDPPQNFETTLNLGEMTYTYLKELEARAKAKAAERAKMAAEGQQGEASAADVMKALSGQAPVTAAQQQAVNRLMERLAPLMGTQAAAPKGGK